MNRTTYDWIRPSLIATSKLTSIVPPTSAPHSVKELHVLDRPPISSAFIKDQKLMGDYAGRLRSIS